MFAHALSAAASLTEILQKHAALLQRERCGNRLPQALEIIKRNRHRYWCLFHFYGFVIIQWHGYAHSVCSFPFKYAAVEDRCTGCLIYKSEIGFALIHLPELEPYRCVWIKQGAVNMESQ